MTAILKITAGAAAMCAACALIILATAWLAFEFLGVFTLIIVYCLAIIVFFVVYTGYATGTIASAIEDRHPVIYAVIAALLLCLAIGAAVTASPLSIDRQEITWLSAGVVSIAAWQAHRLAARKREGF